MMKFKGLIAATVTALLTMPSAYAADKTIAFISADNAISFYKYGMDAAVEAGKALNVDVLTYSSKSDPSQELANVQDAITKGAKGIVMYAVSLSSERAAIAQAKRAGVPIFLECRFAFYSACSTVKCRPANTTTRQHCSSTRTMSEKFSVGMPPAKT